MSMDSGMAQDIGNLIADLDPYAERQDPTKDRQTGTIYLYAGNPVPGTLPGRSDQIELEVDGRYAGEWNFKGEPRKINKAVRIRYRVPVKNRDGDTLYWVDEYLLIGFEGANCF